MYRGQLNRKRKQRVEAEKKAGEYRVKESNQRTEAAKARVAATKTSSASTARSKLNEAERKERDTASAGAEANRWSTRAAGYLREEVSLQAKVTNADQSRLQQSNANVRRSRRRPSGRRSETGQRWSRASRVPSPMLTKSHDNFRHRSPRGCASSSSAHPRMGAYGRPRTEANPRCGPVCFAPRPDRARRKASGHDPGPA